MKRSIIEHSFNETVEKLSRLINSGMKFPGFETIVIPVERKHFRDYLVKNKKSGTKQ